MAKPTYSEFRRSVYQKYLECMKAYDQEEVKEYFKGDEATKEIKDAYRNNAKRFDDGELSSEVFLGDAASSVAYCLLLMF